MNDRITLYHGSAFDSLLPEFGKGEEKHDYGKGLYLTPDINLAREWAVCNGNRGYLYKLDIDFSELSILNFDELNPLHWIAELMSHRAADHSSRYKKLAPLFITKYKIDTAKYDIIQGWRADSSYFSIAKTFVRDGLDAALLPEALQLGDLGIQYCIRSQRAFERISRPFQPMESVDVSRFSAEYNRRDRTAREKLKELIESDRNTLTDTFVNYI